MASDARSAPIGLTTENAIDVAAFIIFALDYCCMASYKKPCTTSAETAKNVQIGSYVAPSPAPIMSFHASSSAWYATREASTASRSIVGPTADGSPSFARTYGSWSCWSFTISYGYALVTVGVQRKAITIPLQKEEKEVGAVAPEMQAVEISQKMAVAAP